MKNKIRLDRLLPRQSRKICGNCLYWKSSSAMYDGHVCECIFINAGTHKAYNRPITFPQTSMKIYTGKYFGCRHFKYLVKFNSLQRIILKIAEVVSAIRGKAI